MYGNTRLLSSWSAQIWDAATICLRLQSDTSLFRSTYYPTQRELRSTDDNPNLHPTEVAVRQDPQSPKIRKIGTVKRLIASQIDQDEQK